MRIILSFVLILILVCVANLAQALAVGLAFGPEGWSSTQMAIDLMTRGLALWLASFCGAYVAREKTTLLAAISGGVALAFGVVAIASSPVSPGFYNYASAAVLVAAVIMGPLCWRLGTPRSLAARHSPGSAFGDERP